MGVPIHVAKILTYPEKVHKNNIGKAHDMFSRIFQIRIYNFFSTKILCNICFDFLKLLKTEKELPYLSHKIFFLFQLSLKGSLDSIPSPSPSVKIQIIGGEVCLRCKPEFVYIAQQCFAYYHK